MSAKKPKPAPGHHTPSVHQMIGAERQPGSKSVQKPSKPGSNAFSRPGTPNDRKRVGS